MKVILTVIGMAGTAACLLIIFNLAYAQMPGADPDALWNYITKENPYQNWKFFPDHQGMQPGRAPHGPQHKVYVNDAAFNSAKPPVQYGSIIVKDNYSKDNVLLAITVMYKVKDYNPPDGDWFWVKYTPGGKASPYGMPKGCIGCHGTRAQNDFILVHEFK
jgi:hypothetical protein